MPRPTQEWLAAQYHDGRFRLPDAHYHVLWDMEHDALASTFRSISASGEAGLDRTTLTRLIQPRLPPDLSPTFGETLYRILAYHSKAPFYPAPTDPLPPSLSLADVQRGLAWLLPDRHLRMAEMGNHGRTRTPADQRRLLFQSLATRSVAVPDDAGREAAGREAARRRHAHRHAHVVEHMRKHHGRWYVDDAEMLADMAKPNRDDDGDEMYHDLLDVLQKNVPENAPYGSARDDLRPLARTLRPAVAFHTLAIPRAELADLVRALVPLQFETASSATDPAFAEPARAAMAAFRPPDGRDDDDDDEDDAAAAAALAAAYPCAADLVAWPAFDRALQRIPRLVGPVYRLLVDVLLDGQAVGVDDYPGDEAPPELRGPVAAPPHVLSPGRMALAHALLPPCVDYAALRTVLRWRRPPTPGAADAALAGLDLDALWARVGPRPRVEGEAAAATLVAVSGRQRPSGAPFAGGLLAAADYDGDGGRALVSSLYPFRVTSPAGRRQWLGRQWRRDGATLRFGDTAISGVLDETGAVECVHAVRPETLEIELDALEVWCDGE